VEVQLHSFLNLALDTGEGFASSSASSTAGKISPGIPLIRRLGKPRAIPLSFGEA
jgi:hypothetical protein